MHIKLINKENPAPIFAEPYEMLYISVKFMICLVALFKSVLILISQAVSSFKPLTFNFRVPAVSCQRVTSSVLVEGKSLPNETAEKFHFYLCKKNTYYLCIYYLFIYYMQQSIILSFGN